MTDKPFAHLRVQVDKKALQAGAVYHGGILKATAAGTSSLSVYDGNGTDGALLDFFACAQGAADRHVLERGVDLRVGLYVDLGLNVDSFVVFYEPPEERER